MVKISVEVDDDLDQEFRAEIMRRKGYKQGNMREAIQEALRLWINTPEVPP